MRKWIVLFGITAAAMAVVVAAYVGLAQMRRSGMFTGMGLLLSMVMGWWVLYGEPEHEQKRPRWSSRRARRRREKATTVNGGARRGA